MMRNSKPSHYNPKNIVDMAGYALFLSRQFKSAADPVYLKRSTGPLTSYLRYDFATPDDAFNIYLDVVSKIMSSKTKSDAANTAMRESLANLTTSRYAGDARLIALMEHKI